MACDSGTRELFATPHVISGSWQPSWDRILTLTGQLNGFAGEKGLRLTVRPGAEVAMDWSLLELLTAPGPYCLNGGRFILIELPLGHLPTYADEFLFTLQTRDFWPILAHPERNPDVKKDPLRLRHWLEKGILAQINAASLLGTMGSRTQAAAETLLRNQGVHFLGSDAHGVGVRRPDLREAVEAIRAVCGDTGVRRILQDNPRHLLNGPAEKIEPAQPLAAKPPTKKRGLAARLKQLWKKIKMRAQTLPVAGF